MNKKLNNNLEMNELTINCLKIIMSIRRKYRGEGMEIKVCVGSACYVKGSHEVIQKISQLIDKYHMQESLELKAAFCLGHCTQAVSVEFDGVIYGVDKDEVETFFVSEVCRRIKGCK